MVGHLEAAYDLSQRRACALTGFPRSSQRYRARRIDDPGMHERLKQLAHERPRFGYERLHILLRRDGFLVNHTRVRRLRSSPSPANNSLRDLRRLRC